MLWDRQTDSGRERLRSARTSAALLGGEGRGELLPRNSETSVSPDCSSAGVSFKTQITSLPCSKLSADFASHTKQNPNPCQSLPGPTVVPDGNRTAFGGTGGTPRGCSGRHTTTGVISGALGADNLKRMGWSHTAQKHRKPPVSSRRPLDILNAILHFMSM